MSDSGPSEDAITAHQLVIAKLERQFKDYVERVQGDIASLREELAEANRFYSIAEAENGRLASVALEAEADLERMRADRDGYQAVAENLQRENERLTDEVNKLRFDFADCNTERLRLQAALEKENERICELLEENQRLHADIDRADRMAKINIGVAGKVAVKNDKLKHWVSNLLARIHRDGGHYEAEHGTDKACADADEKLAWMLVAADERDLFRRQLDEAEAQLKEAWSENERLRDPENLRLYANTHEGKDKWLETNGSLYLKWSVVADYLRVSPRKRSAVKEPPPDWMGVLHP